jgi:hypothetical protein
LPEKTQSSDNCSDNSSSGDPVEVALASAIAEATKAARWDVVALLARELETRRVARTAPNVVSIARAKKSDR